MMSTNSIRGAQGVYLQNAVEDVETRDQSRRQIHPLGGGPALRQHPFEERDVDRGLQA